MLDGKPLEADVIVIATGVWKAEMFPRIVKPISAIMGINFLYKSTPQGSDDFDMGKIPCWIEHGQGLFGIPSLEGSGVKAAVVIPNTPIDINKDERIIEKSQFVRHVLILDTDYLGLRPRALSTVSSIWLFALQIHIL